MTEFYIIATIFNPAGYASRYRLYHNFHEHIAATGGSLITIELAFENQPFAVTDSGNPHHIQLRSNHQIWYKENLVNIAIRRLPPTWTHAAWMDADIAFVQPDWQAQTLAALERHPFVQMFTHAIDLGPDDQPLRSYDGFVYRHRTNPAASARREFAQPGYAWAARREAFEAMGGLIDWSILGSNDYFMAQAMIGVLEPEATRMPGSTYTTTILDWQDRFQKRIGPDIGFVETTLHHHWHGRRADRGYDTRWRILVDNSFDPATDLRYNADGLLELTNAKPALRDAIRAYFQSRKEDNPDL